MTFLNSKEGIFDSKYTESVKCPLLRKSINLRVLGRLGFIL